MINVFLDCETTGINPYCNDIIEAYFYVNDEVNYHYKAKPLQWSHEAELIHNISYAKAMTYPDKSEAIKNLLTWSTALGSFRFITYANKNTELGIVNFDVAILWNELNLLGYPQYYLENNMNMKAPLSVHDTAKQCAKSGYFKPIKGESGRVSYSQENVYKALFDDKYEAHNCIEDVKALVRIYSELVRLKDENQSIFALVHSWRNKKT